MSPADREFYNRLYPALAEGDWEETGEEAHGSIAFWLTMPPAQLEGIIVNVGVGLLKATDSEFIVRISPFNWDDISYTQTIGLASSFDFATMNESAWQAANNLLADKLTEIMRELSAKAISILH